MNAKVMGQALGPKPNSISKIATPHLRFTAVKTAPAHAPVTFTDHATVEIVGDNIESGVWPNKLLRSGQLVVPQGTDEEAYSVEHDVCG
jgi:hypothetical protein